MYVCVLKLLRYYNAMLCLPIVSDRAATEGSKYFELGRQPHEFLTRNTCLYNKAPGPCSLPPRLYIILHGKCWYVWARRLHKHSSMRQCRVNGQAHFACILQHTQCNNYYEETRTVHHIRSHTRVCSYI